MSRVLCSLVLLAASSVPAHAETWRVSIYVYPSIVSAYSVGTGENARAAKLFENVLSCASTRQVQDLANYASVVETCRGIPPLSRLQRGVDINLGGFRRRLQSAGLPLPEVDVRIQDAGLDGAQSFSRPLDSVPDVIQLRSTIAPWKPAAFAGSLALLLVIALLVNWRFLAYSRNQNVPREDRWLPMVWWLGKRDLLTWTAWLIVILSFNATDLIGRVVMADNGPKYVLCWFAIILLPAAANTVGAISTRRVWTELRGLSLTGGDVVRPGVILNLVFVALAVFCVLDFQGTAIMPGAIIFLVMVFLFGYSRFAGHRAGVSAVDQGELRDAVFGIAQRMGVPVRRLLVYPENRWRMFNAFAANGNTVMLSQLLVQALDRREVNVLIAHELAHVKHNHVRKPGLFLIVLLMPVGIALPFLNLNVLWIAIPVVLAMMFALPILRRRYEYEADATAVAVTGDGEALIRALGTVSRQNVLPVNWSLPWTLLMTHPPTLARCYRIAKQCGIEPERVPLLLAVEMRRTVPPYLLPAADQMQGRIFSSRYKSATALSTLVILIAVLAFGSAAVAWLADRYSANAPLIYLIGNIATVLLASASGRLYGVDRNNSLAGRIRRKLESAGEIDSQTKADLVALSPASRPMLFENRYEWDLGYAWLDDGVFSYRGELGSFDLAPSSVTKIATGTGAVVLRGVPAVFVYFRDPATGGERVINVRVVATGLSPARGGTQRLYRELLEWHRGATPGESRSTIPAETGVTAALLGLGAYQKLFVFLVAGCFMIDTLIGVDPLQLSITVVPAALLYCGLTALPVLLHGKSRDRGTTASQTQTQSSQSATH